MNQTEWIEKAYQLLCQSQGDPTNPTEERHMREWAASLTTDSDYFKDGYSPTQAVADELSNA